MYISIIFTISHLFLILTSHATDDLDLGLPSYNFPSVLLAIDCYEQAVIYAGGKNLLKAKEFYKRSASIFDKIPITIRTHFYIQDLTSKGYTFENLVLDYDVKKIVDMKVYEQNYSAEKKFFDHSKEAGSLYKDYKRYTSGSLSEKEKKRTKTSKLLRSTCLFDQNGWHIIGNFFLKGYRQLTEENSNKRQSNLPVKEDLLKTEKTEEFRRLALILFEKSVIFKSPRPWVKFIALGPEYITVYKIMESNFSSPILSNPISEDKTDSLIRIFVGLMDTTNEIYKHSPERFIPEHQQWANLAERMDNSVCKFYSLMIARILGHCEKIYEELILKTHQSSSDMKKSPEFYYLLCNSYFPALKEKYISDKKVPHFNVKQALKSYTFSYDDDSKKYFKEIILPKITDYQQGLDYFSYLHEKDPDVVTQYLGHVVFLQNKNVFPSEIIEYIGNHFTQEGFVFIPLIDKIYNHFITFANPLADSYLKFANTIIKPLLPFTYSLALLDGISKCYMKAAEVCDTVCNQALKEKGLEIIKQYINTFNDKDPFEILEKEGSPYEKQIYKNQIVSINISKVMKRLANRAARSYLNPLLLKDNKFIDFLYYLNLARQKGSFKALGNLTRLYLKGYSPVEINHKEASVYASEIVEKVRSKSETDSAYPNKIQYKLERFIRIYLQDQKAEFYSSFVNDIQPFFDAKKIQQEIEDNRKRDIEYRENIDSKSFKNIDLYLQSIKKDSEKYQTYILILNENVKKLLKIFDPEKLYKTLNTEEVENRLEILNEEELENNQELKAIKVRAN